MDPALNQISHLLDALGCGACLLHRSGVIAYANRRLCDYMDRPFLELAGRHLHEIYPPEDRAAIDQRLARFDEDDESEFFVPRADGRRVAVLVSGRRLTGDEPLPDYRVLTLIDISERQRAEQRLREQYNEVSKLTDVVVEQALELRRYSELLEERVRQRTEELHEANVHAIYMLAVASEAKDQDTGAHVRRIQYYCEAIARRIGLADQAEHIGISAILHDVGKMQVPDQILKKPGPLSDEERRQMQSHTLVGERIISPKPFFDIARIIARHHHENWDGSGYPDGLAGAAIPLAARIVRVADMFDALISERVYKQSWPREKAFEVMLQASGVYFDPEIVTAFVSLNQENALPPITPGGPA
jgi:PAS domain S-box-containing protein